MNVHLLFCFTLNKSSFANYFSSHPKSVDEFLRKLTQFSEYCFPKLGLDFPTETKAYLDRLVGRLDNSNGRARLADPAPHGCVQARVEWEEKVLSSVKLQPLTLLHCIESSLVIWIVALMPDPGLYKQTHY